MGDTTLTVTGIRSALSLAASGISGLLAVSSAVAGTSGYRLTAAETSEGIAYTTIGMVSEKNVTDAPTISVSLDYGQDVKINELDFDVRYTAIPQGTSLQLICSKPELSISKQGVSGTSLVGSSAKKVVAFTGTVELLLWITQPGALEATSEVSLNISSIQSSDAGPMKKTLLQKSVVKLGA